MRCYICNKPIDGDELRFDPFTKKADPCFDCSEVVDQTVYSYDEDDEEGCEFPWD